MSPIDKQIDDRQALCTGISDWFEQPLGRTLQAGAARQLHRVLPKLFGTQALQVGRIGKRDMLAASVIPTKIYLDILPYRRHNHVCGLPEALPFETKSIDVALLPHTLDFSPEPHQVLREVHRVLSPEGHMVVLGFNPFSLWGLWRLAAKHTGRAPWCGRFVSVHRLRDWLSLLDCEVTQGNMFFYRPPFRRERLLDQLYFLDKIGDRWWPLAGGVYLLVAKKRVLGVTPLRPQWKENGVGNSAATQTVTRGMARHG